MNNKELERMTDLELGKKEYTKQEIIDNELLIEYKTYDNLRLLYDEFKQRWCNPIKSINIKAYPYFSAKFNCVWNQIKDNPYKIITIDQIDFEEEIEYITCKEDFEGKYFKIPEDISEEDFEKIIKQSEKLGFKSNFNYYRLKGGKGIYVDASIGGDWVGNYVSIRDNYKEITLEQFMGKKEGSTVLKLKPGEKFEIPIFDYKPKYITTHKELLKLDGKRVSFEFLGKSHEGIIKHRHIAGLDIFIARGDMGDVISGDGTMYNKYEEDNKGITNIQLLEEEPKEETYSKSNLEKRVEYLESILLGN